MFTAGNSVDYTYDSIGQLKAATGRESGGTTRLHEKLGYAYDAAGNLNHRTNNALVQSFGVNSLNELTTATRSGTLTVAGTTTSAATNVTVNGLTADIYDDHAFAKAGFTVTNGWNSFTAIAQDGYGRVDTNTTTSYPPTPVSFAYDLNGNLTNDGLRSFYYDDENQLTAVMVEDEWKSEFEYDGKMRRRIRCECTWSGTAWVTNGIVRYVYDGNLVLQERDGSNLPQVTYTRGTDLSGTMQGAGGIGGLLARTDASETSVLRHGLYHADGNGNVTCLASTNQLVLARYHYDAYGNTLAASGPLAQANVYRFSSKEVHPSSGLVYYLYRYYDPSLQRWINQDPDGERGGLNLFSFVNNTAINAIDDFGLGVMYMGTKDGRGTVIVTPPQPERSARGSKVREWFVPDPKQTWEQGNTMAAAAFDSELPTHERISAGISVPCIVVLGVTECVPGSGGATKPLKRKCTSVLTDVTVKSHKQIIGEGTVHLRPVIEGIESGTLKRKAFFKNKEGLLPSKPKKYYEEFVVPTPAAKDAGAQRIVKGKGGELYYTPDHYGSFIQLTGN